MTPQFWCTWEAADATPMPLALAQRYADMGVTCIRAAMSFPILYAQPDQPINWQYADDTIGAITATGMDVYFDLNDFPAWMTDGLPMGTELPEGWPTRKGTGVEYAHVDTPTVHDFAVQIGLTENGECVLGVVYQPLTGVLYRAVRGGGTWIERPDYEVERARVSDHREISTMRLAASRSHRSPRMDKVVQALGFREEVRRGSVGIKVGLIVEQQCDLYIHLSPRTKQWDTCAPEIILREAGGCLTDLFGRPLRYNKADLQNRNGIVASNGVAHTQVIESLAPLLVQFGRASVE